MKHRIHPELYDPHDSYGEHESSHYKAIGFDDNIQRDKFKRPYVMPRWLGSLIGMIVSALFLWGNHILRMLNAIVQ